MTPVEDQYSPHGLPRAARYNLCVGVRYRVDVAHGWRRGVSTNISRSGVLFHAGRDDAFSPTHRTEPHRPIEVVIEVTKGAVISQIHCHATVARVVEPLPGTNLGAIAATVGDYILLAT
jgi:hypothetical protein